MPTVRKRGTVAIDTVPLPERTAPGVIQKAGEKFVLEVGGRKFDVPVGPILSEADLELLVGTEVTAVFSKTRPEDLVAIGTWPTPERKKPGFHCVLCYKPAPDILKRIEPAIRKAVIREMVREKIISAALGRRLQP